jgi:hypothetical protein
MKLVFVFIALQFFASFNGQDVDPSICSGIWVGLLPHPDPQLCRFYIRCFVSVPTVLECPENKMFVPHYNASAIDGTCEPGK